MATLRQIEANRRNALKSTGPRSIEGKAASRLNALKTGIHAQLEIIPSEDANELAALAAEYCGRFQPAAPEERALVDSLVHHEWLLRRLRAAEAQLWDYTIMDTESSRLPNDYELGRVADRRQEAFSRLQRRIDSAERNYHRSLKELQRLQPAAPMPAGRAQPSLPPSAPRPPASPIPQIGFVPPVPPSGAVLSCLNHLSRRILRPANPQTELVAAVGARPGTARKEIQCA